MKVCKCCGKPLNESQYNKEHNYKSCPRCSTINGEEHVFFPYPVSYGITDARKSMEHPDGPQSYCVSHRGNATNPIPSGGLLCSICNK